MKFLKINCIPGHAHHIIMKKILTSCKCQGRGNYKRHRCHRMTNYTRPLPAQSGKKTHKHKNKQASWNMAQNMAVRLSQCLAHCLPISGIQPGPILDRGRLNLESLQQVIQQYACCKLCRRTPVPFRSMFQVRVGTRLEARVLRKDSWSTTLAMHSATETTPQGRANMLNMI